MKTDVNCTIKLGNKQNYGEKKNDSASNDYDLLKEVKFVKVNFADRGVRAKKV